MENVSDVQIAWGILEWPVMTGIRHFSDGLILNQQKAIKQKSIQPTVYEQQISFKTEHFRESHAKTWAECRFVYWAYWRYL